MGVSIEGYAEVRSDGRWAFAGRMVPNPFQGYDRDEPEVMPEALFISDSKELAAILTDTGNPIRSIYPYTPVVRPRGLPPDLSSELGAWLRRREEQGETWEGSTWFTARDAAAFGWDDRIQRRRAYVTPQVAPLFAGCPRGFPLATWPAGVPVQYSGWSSDGVAVEWRESYAEIVPEFARDVLPRLGGFGPPDDVRLVVVASW
jgi:hypothetical protein